MTRSANPPDQLLNGIGILRDLDDGTAQPGKIIGIMVLDGRLIPVVGQGDKRLVLADPADVPRHFLREQSDWIHRSPDSYLEVVGMPNDAAKSCQRGSAATMAS